MPRPVIGIEIKRNKGCLEEFNGEQERGQADGERRNRVRCLGESRKDVEMSLEG